MIYVPNWTYHWYNLEDFVSTRQPGVEYFIQTDAELLNTTNITNFAHYCIS